jgi:fatty-acyl-CoA synthase
MIQNNRIIDKVDEAYPYPLLIKQLLHTPIVYSPEQEIVYRDIKRFTYREFYSRIKKLATALTAIGVGAGDMIAVMDWDSNRYLECYFAIPGIGAVIHNVNVRLAEEQILYTMQHAEDTYVFVNEDFVPMMERLHKQLPTVKKWILIKETKQSINTKIPFEYEYEKLLSIGKDDFVFPEFDENTHATLSYTTGTTGEPKGVYFSHRQIVLHTLGVGFSLGALPSRGAFRSDDVYMPITPMFHVHAWGMPYLATLMGVKQVYPGRYDPEILIQLIETELVTFSHCVPTILQMLLSSQAGKHADLSHWKVLIGGSALSRGLAKIAMDRGIEVYTAYGMSETCPILTLAMIKPEMENADEEVQLNIRTSTGLPVPLVDLKIQGEDRSLLPKDGKSVGEIIVRAPWLTQGYFKKPDQGAELWEGGYLHTGDVAHMNQEGYVRITDRIKDVIKTGGEWVSSLELEDLISQHPNVAEVAVIGVMDEKWGERPVAMVVPKDIENLSEKQIKAFLMKYVEAGIISRYAIPDSIKVVESIPKTSVGKIDKKLLRKVMKES